MTPDNDHTSHHDIQDALNQAQRLGSAEVATDEPVMAEALAEPVSGHTCPMRSIRFGMFKCGMMAEKYPWQTTAAMIATIGCGWVCSYFGLTLFAGLVLYAVTAEDE